MRSEDGPLSLPMATRYLQSAAMQVVIAFWEMPEDLQRRPENRVAINDLGAAAANDLPFNAVECELPEAALDRLQEAVMAVHRRIGSPGDFGYGHYQGEALRGLYSALNFFHAARKEAKKRAKL